MGQQDAGGAAAARAAPWWGDLWGARVLHQGRSLTREDCARALETLYSFECRSNGRSIHSEPSVVLAGRELCLTVARQLLTLPGGAARRTELLESEEVERAIELARATLASLGTGRQAEGRGR